MYDGLGCSVLSEGAAGGFDVGRELGLVECFFGRRVVFFGDDVVDGFHLCLFFIYMQKYN